MTNVSATAAGGLLCFFLGSARAAATCSGDAVPPRIRDARLVLERAWRDALLGPLPGRRRVGVRLPSDTLRRSGPDGPSASTTSSPTPLLPT